MENQDYYFNNIIQENINDSIKSTSRKKSSIKVTKSVECLDIEHDEIDNAIKNEKETSNDKKRIEELKLKRRRISNQLFEAYIYAEDYQCYDYDDDYNEDYKN